MGILTAVLSAFQTHFGSLVQAILIAVPAFIVQGLVMLGEDEAKIFLDALNAMLADIKAGKTWSAALADAMTVFYNEEHGEGQKLGLAALEFFAQQVGSLTTPATPTPA